MLIVVIFLLFILGCLNNVKADIVNELPDFAQIAKDKGYDVDEMPYYCIVQNGSDLQYYSCLFSDSPIYVRRNDDNTYSAISDMACVKKMLRIRVDVSTGNVSKILYEKQAMPFLNYTCMLYSNSNLKNWNTSDDVPDNTYFFYAVPLKGTTSPIIGLNISTQTIANGLTLEVLTIVPYLVVLVISFLALRKALVALVHFLRKA